MSITIQWANSNKRRNSTKQFQPGTDSHITVTLKENTSIDHPTFIISAPWIGWNVCKWGDRYYFVDDIVSIGNGLWEVSCVMDVLATFKADILASTFYVSYAKDGGGSWIPDTRLVQEADTHKTSSSSDTLSSLSDSGFYALTVAGMDGCAIFEVYEHNIQALLSELSNWKEDDYSRIASGSEFSPYHYNYDWTNSPDESKAMMDMMTSFRAQAWSDAASAIRSCIWVPLKASSFRSAEGNKTITLGAYATSLNNPTLNNRAVHIETNTVSIPWHYSDFRRTSCEDVYIYLPFVGVINLSSHDLCQCSSITVETSACCVDGSLKFVVKASNGAILGIYGAQIGSNYPIGINQGTSPVERKLQQLEGERDVNNALSSIQLLNPFSWATGVAGTSMAMKSSDYKNELTKTKRSGTVIGAYGGCSFTTHVLDKTIYCWTLYNDTVNSPSSMASTMGLPVMKPMSLSNLTGFVQCANAHIECSGSAPEKDAIDTMLNSGIFIE